MLPLSFWAISPDEGKQLAGHCDTLSTTRTARPSRDRKAAFNRARQRCRDSSAQGYRDRHQPAQRGRSVECRYQARSVAGMLLLRYLDTASTACSARERSTCCSTLALPFATTQIGDAAARHPYATSPALCMKRSLITNHGAAVRRARGWPVSLQRACNSVVNRHRIFVLLPQRVSARSLTNAAEQP